MPQPYDSRDIDDKFMSTWENNNISTANFGDYNLGNLSQTTLSEQMIAKTQLGIDLRALDLPTTANTYNTDVVAQQGGNPGFDSSLNWML
jgi:hypothetical protein